MARSRGFPATSRGTSLLSAEDHGVGPYRLLRTFERLTNDRDCPTAQLLADNPARLGWLRSVVRGSETETVKESKGGNGPFSLHKALGGVRDRHTGSGGDV